MPTTSNTDVLDLLRRDHLLVEEQFARLEAAAPTDRESHFCELVHFLVGHEVAEELVVYPAIRGDVLDGDAKVEPRLKEQAEAEEQLASMERLDPISAAFGTDLNELRSAVLAHARAEEESLFPLLQEFEDGATRNELGADYERAKDRAPTHPHPHAPDTPPGNKLVGPITALFDRARDAAARAL